MTFSFRTGTGENRRNPSRQTRLPSSSDPPAFARVLWFCFAWVFLIGPFNAGAQVSSIQKALTGAGAPKTETEKPDELRKRLETWQSEARDALARFEAGGSSAALPEGITASDLDNRRRDLEQTELITGAWLKDFDMVANSRKAAETARAEDAAWTGFKEPPPYSILTLDQLLSERDAIRAKLTSNESSLSNFERLLSSMMAETKANEDLVSKTMLAVQNAPDDKKDAPKWRLEAAKAHARLLAARAGYIQSNCDSYRERVAASKAELSLMDRKVKAMSPHALLRDEDLEKVEKICNERKAAYEKEIAAVSKRTKTALAARGQAQSALDDLLANAKDGKEPEGAALARFRVEVAEARITSLQSINESLESLIQLESIALTAYKNRAVLINSKSPEDRGKALDSLNTLSDRLRAWLNVVENDLADSAAELNRIETRAGSISSDDPRFPLVNDQRASRSEMLAALQRTVQMVDAERRVLQRWIDDQTPKTSDVPLSTRLSTFGSNFWETVKRIWGFKIMSFEDRIEVDGQTITGKIPLTLGMLLRALLFFCIGYWVSSRIANRIQLSIVSRGHIAEHQARTLRNWAMIAVSVVLVLGTLSFLKIPLTVFAFFGGALAIGIGFGTQTLIKNFISGLIVLAERKIRVGDMLDVDGIVGTVTEVNTRSSIIRGADDVETMIPNSLFLENRVTNWTLSSRKVRRSVRIGVAYGTDPKTVMEILTESAGRHGLICRDPAPIAVFEDFGDNALIFMLYFWLELGPTISSMVVTSDLRLMIDKRFHEAGIGIPYPQRDMHLATSTPIDVRLAKE